MVVTATFKPTKWEEKPYESFPPSMRFTRASVEYAFTGKMEGRGVVEYLMFYSRYDEHNVHDSIANYVGLTRFTGSLNGKSGSFVWEDRGSFEGGTAKSVVTILPGSGTDDFKGIQGTGSSVATPTMCEFVMEYEVG